MKTFKVLPRFKDTDALGHINNAAYSTWFEEARRPIFQIFIPDLDPKKWNLIIARIEVDFKAQGNYQDEVEITTVVEQIGNSSFILIQEAFQKGTLLARGKSVLVHFDYKENRSKLIPAEIKHSLESFKLKN